MPTFSHFKNFTMKHLITCVVLLVLGFGSQAQVVTITDAQTNKPLEGVTLMSSRGAAFTVTNSKGQASIAAFPTDEPIEIRRLGYRARTVQPDALQAEQYTVRLERSNLELDQVVISATRRVERDRLVANRIRRVDAEQIALQNPQTAADLLGGSGEVFIQKSQQGGGSPMIRGFATNRILIAVDGVRMNNAIFRSGNLQNVISIDPFAVQSAEVVFGPGSVIYGSDAIGAVMSFQTLAPQLSHTDEPLVKGNAALRTSSANDERTAHLDATVGWKRWALVSSFTHNTFGDLRMGTRGPRSYQRTFYVNRIDSVDRVVANPDPLVQVSSGYRQDNFMQKVHFAPSEKLQLTYALHYSTTGLVPRYDRLIETTANRSPRDAEWNYGPQKWMMNHLQIRVGYDTPLWDEATVSIAHQQFEESRITRGFGSNNRNTRVEEVAALSANVDFLKALGNKGQLTYGLEAVTNEVTSTGTRTQIRTLATNPINSRYPQSDWASYAAYAAYRHQLFENFWLQAGARYNVYTLDARFDTSLFALPYNTASLENSAATGSLGLLWQNDNLWINGAISSGFRAPNVDDIGKIFEQVSGQIMVPNADLKAEYGINYELGVGVLVDERVKVEITGYYTQLNNAMVRRDFRLNGQDFILFDGNTLRVQAIQNAAEARVYGIQAALDADLGQGFGISGRFNWQRGEEELDNGETSRSRHAAPWFGMGRFYWKNEKLLLECSAMYSGEVTFENLAFEERLKTFIYAIDPQGRPWSPSWYTINLRAMVQLNDTFTVSGGLENITDQRYRPYSSGIAAPGRNVVLAVRATF